MDIKEVLKEKYQEDQVILDILEDDLIIKKLNEISEIINRKIKNFNLKIIHPHKLALIVEMLKIKKIN